MWLVHDAHVAMQDMMTEDKVDLLKITMTSKAPFNVGIAHNSNSDHGVFVKHAPIDNSQGTVDYTSAPRKNSLLKEAWEQDITVQHQQPTLNNDNDDQSKCSLSNNDKNLTKLRRILMWRIMYRFLSTTSLHGLPQLTSTKSFFCGLTYWIIILLIALGLMLWALISVTKQYSQMNTVLFSKLQFNSQLLFPAVTICNKNYFRKSVAASTGIDLNELVKFLNVASGDPFIAAGFNFTSFFEEHKDLIGKEDSIFYFNNSGQQLEQMVYSCKYAGEDCLNSFTMRSSSNGNCYTFNSGINASTLYSIKRGHRFGLEVILNAEEYEYFVAETDSVGFNVFIHNQDHFPYYDDSDSFSVKTGQQTQVALRKVDYKLLKLDHGHGGQCGDINLKYFNSYSYSSCVAECLTNIIVSTCKCKSQSLPGPAKVCRLTDMCLYDTFNSFKEERCDCPIPCDYTIYEKTLSYSKFPANHFTELLNNSDFLLNSHLPEFVIGTIDINGTEVQYLNENFTDSFLKDNLVKLRIYYDNLITTTMEEGLEYSTFQFIADFGGHVGLFTGAGFLTIFEIFQLCFGLTRPADD